MDSLNFGWSFLLGPGKIGTVYENPMLDVMILYGLHGELIVLEVNEKFKTIN